MGERASRQNVGRAGVCVSKLICWDHAMVSGWHRARVSLKFKSRRFAFDHQRAADACAHPANTCGRPARSAFSRKRRPVSQPFPANLARRWAMPSAARTFAKTERRAVPFSCAVRAPRDRLQGLLMSGFMRLTSPRHRPQAGGAFRLTRMVRRPALRQP